jgi:hypothetical protein
VVERFALALADLSPEYVVNLLDVPLVQCNEDGLFIGEVLVDRANANTRCFSNVVGSNRGHAASPEQPDHGVQNGFDRLLRPALSGLTAPRRTFCRLPHIRIQSIWKCEHLLNFSILNREDAAFS